MATLPVPLCRVLSQRAPLGSTDSGALRDEIRKPQLLRMGLNSPRTAAIFHTFRLYSDLLDQFTSGYVAHFAFQHRAPIIKDLKAIGNFFSQMQVLFDNKK